MKDLAMARVERQTKKLFEKIASYDLIIIDDFGIKKLNNEQILDLMEITSARRQSSLRRSRYRTGTTALRQTQPLQTQYWTGWCTPQYVLS